MQQVLPLKTRLESFCFLIKNFIANKKKNILFDLSEDVYYQTIFDYMKTTMIFHSIALGNPRSIEGPDLSIVRPLYDTIENELIQEVERFINTENKDVLKDNSSCGICFTMSDVKPIKAIETIYGIVCAYERLYQLDRSKRKTIVGKKNSQNRRLVWSCCWWMLFCVFIITSFFVLMILVGHIIQFIVEWFGN